MYPMMHHCCRPACVLPPIVMPERVCYVQRCIPVEQPVIVPTRTHVVNRYVTYPRYIPTHTTTVEPVVCPGAGTAATTTTETAPTTMTA